MGTEGELGDKGNYTKTGEKETTEKVDEDDTHGEAEKKKEENGKSQRKEQKRTSFLFFSSPRFPPFPSSLRHSPLLSSPLPFLFLPYSPLSSILYSLVSSLFSLPSSFFPLPSHITLVFPAPPPISLFLSITSKGKLRERGDKVENEERKRKVKTKRERTQNIRERNEAKREEKKIHRHKTAAK